MSDKGEAQAIIEAAEHFGVIQERFEHIGIVGQNDDGERLPVRRVRIAGGGDTLEVMRDVLDTLDARAPAPRRRKGTAVLTELASFIAHVNRYRDQAPESDSVVYADIEAFTLTAVYNEHPPGGDHDVTGWRDHRAQYTCPRSPEWLAWTEMDGEDQEQDAFADFIESHLESLVSGSGFPAPTEVLQMARDLTVLTEGTFQRQVNPTTGASVLVNKTEHKTGSTQIPRAFLLAIPVFEGGERYQVEARLRFVLESGRPVFSYTLHRRTEIERDAFGAMRGQVATETGVVVLAGKAG